MKYSLSLTTSRRYWLPTKENMPPISNRKGSTFARITCSSCRSLCSSASSKIECVLTFDRPFRLVAESARATVYRNWFD